MSPTSKMNHFFLRRLAASTSWAQAAQPWRPAAQPPNRPAAQPARCPAAQPPRLPAAQQPIHFFLRRPKVKLITFFCVGWLRQLAAGLKQPRRPVPQPPCRPRPPACQPPAESLFSASADCEMKQVLSLFSGPVTRPGLRIRRIEALG